VTVQLSVSRDSAPDICHLTDEEDETWFPAEMSVARRQAGVGGLWRQTVPSPALQPQETLGHRELIDGLTAPARAVFVLR